MRLEHLQQAQAILSKCGRPLLPDGVSAVPIPRAFVMPMVLEPGGSVTFVKEITGDTPWVLRAISSDQTSASLIGARIQIQLPNGRFLFGGNGVDIGQFCWIGSWRWNQDPELRCNPGSVIRVTLSDPAQTLQDTQAVNLLFEGADLYFMKGGESIPYNSSLASQLPRYFGDVNENILASAWMFDAAIPKRPGYEPEVFTYSTLDPADSPTTSTWVLTANAITTAPIPLPFEIPIDAGYEFWVRRMLFDIQVTGSAAAIVVGKLRTGAGYILNDNYIDLARYLCGAEYPGWWKVKGTDSVFADLALLDFSGTGNVTYQIHLEGIRWRKI